MHKIQQAFEDDVTGISWIKKWCNHFKDGRTSVDSEPRPGRPSVNRNDSVIDQVLTFDMHDHRITLRELTNEVGLCIGSVHYILTEDLGLKKVSAKFVPKLLTVEQKQLCLKVVRNMRDNRNSNANFLSTVTTCVQSYVYGI